MSESKKIYINKSHSKSELVEIITHFRINVGDPTNYNKKELQEVLINKLILMKDEDINYCNKYFCDSVEDIIKYLINYNVRKILSVREKETIMKITKRLNNYCKNDFQLEFTLYQNIYEIITDAQKISKFGESPTVRKTLELINNDPKINIIIKPMLTPQDAIALAEQELKNNMEKENKITFRRAPPGKPFIVSFD
tara:strand:+ start:890 stop:1477 length:588 start_codon:yes stop_codon:yes gene_type:complete